MTMNNYYALPKGYLENPFDPLYNLEVDITDDAISELIDFASSLDECIRGDFDLSEITTSIQRRFLNFVEIGLLAFKVKSWNIWKENKSLKSFKDYCLKILNRPVWQINNAICSARVVTQLIAAGFTQLPQSMAQALELARFGGEELIEKWDECLKSIHPQQLSAKKIKELVDPTPPEKQIESIRLPKKLMERLRKKANAEDLSIGELLEDWLNANDEASLPPDDEKLQAWEDDLADLIEDHDRTQKEGTSRSNLGMFSSGTSEIETEKLISYPQPTIFTSLFIHAYLRAIGKLSELDYQS